MVQTNKKVAVAVFDLRPIPEVIGVRHKSKNQRPLTPLFKEQSIPYINNYENLSTKVRTMAEFYLKGDGLEVIQDCDQESKKLEITLEVFKYESIEVSWYQMPKTKIRLYFTSRVKDENGNIVHTGQHEYTVEYVHAIFQPRSKKNEKNLSIAFSEGVKRIFDDQTLMGVLKSSLPSNNI